ncbi:MAG TPA: hypothetical protein VEV84_14000 [Pyrinomonadaceae bacterium]|jgi:hypothetical protein|nr:hypothetical protein [Pyrinomonadaceae bacterium]
MVYKSIIYRSFLLFGILFTAHALTETAFSAQFLGGPSVRVNPNTSTEFKWITDVAWFGKVEIFTTADGSGTPILVQNVIDGAGTRIAATQQTLTINVASVITPDTTFYFRVTAWDPTGSNGDLIMPAPLPSFFTGAQTISNVRTDSVTTTGATVSWQANVIGFGKVTFGTPTQTVQDAFNITDHAIDLTGLTPGTTYQFTVSNKHAIDGDVLVTTTGQFTTAQPVTNVVFTQPHAEPRVIQPGQVSTISIRALNKGNPVAGVLVSFAVDPTSEGEGVLSSGQAVTDFNGVASVQFTASASGVVRVNVSSSNATNSPFKIPVVVR